MSTQEPEAERNVSPPPKPDTTPKSYSELLLWDIERNTRATLDELRKLNKLLESIKIPLWLQKTQK